MSPTSKNYCLKQNFCIRLSISAQNVFDFDKSSIFWVFLKSSSVGSRPHNEGMGKASQRVVASIENDTQAITNEFYIVFNRMFSEANSFRLEFCILHSFSD